MKISVIVPCYNEEQVLLETYNRLATVLAEFPSYEIVFVDDGSVDSTAEILFQLSGDSRVKVVTFSRNFGHEAAITADLNYSSGDLVAIIDADLQDPPELIVDMIQEMKKEDADVVYGFRRSRKGENMLKKLSASAFYRILSFLTDSRIPIDTGNFRVMKKDVVDTFNRYSERTRFVRGLLSYVGFRQVPFYYNRDERFAGETKYKFSNMLSLAMNAIFSFSEKPLKIASGIGFFSVMIAFLLMVYSIIGHFSGAEAGWASIMSVLVFFGGIQLFAIGILGEYIARIMLEVKQRPLYNIKQKINLDSNE